jgi:hypothetical protein
VADGVASVPNVVTEDLLVVFALEQVAAWVGLGYGRYHTGSCSLH